MKRTGFESTRTGAAVHLGMEKWPREGKRIYSLEKRSQHAQLSLERKEP